MIVGTSPPTSEKLPVTITGVAIIAVAAGLSFLTSASAGESGIASVYSTDSGKKTANGQRLSPAALTAAHRTLPFGTKVQVTNRRNGRVVVVTINDRGPFVRGRIIDLTPAAARAIGFTGLARVTLAPSQ
jgi:rare lipoprotein A